MNSTAPGFGGKTLPVSVFECYVLVLTCPNIVVIAVDNILSTKGGLICAQNDPGEPRLCSTEFQKTLTKFLSYEIAHWAQCLNFWSMLRVRLLMLHDMPNDSLDA
jgi:hypothetical protein